jgi:hypothetical protein
MIENFHRLSSLIVVLCPLKMGVSFGTVRFSREVFFLFLLRIEFENYVSAGGKWGTRMKKLSNVQS